MKSIKSINSITESLLSSKTVADNVIILKNIPKSDITIFRNNMQESLDIERELIDILLETKHSNPEGIMSMTASDMIEKWNHDMNTFIAILFEICRRTYETKIQQGNPMRVSFMSQTDKIAKYQLQNMRLKSRLENDGQYLQQMGEKIKQFRRDKDYV